MKKFLYLILKTLRKLVSGKEESFRKIPFITKTFNFLYQISGPKGVILVEANGNKMFVDAKASGLVLTGYWEKHETETFKEIIKEGMTVVDIGAHIGYYTLIAASLVGKNGKVYAFEPEPENYSLLLKNIEVNGYQNVILVNKAVSNKMGTAKLFLGTSALHSIVGSSINDKYIQVETITLDNFFEKKEKIDLIKMDAEGAEYMIFGGMQEILKDNNDIIIFTEFYPALLGKYVESQKYLDELTKSNFKLFTINNKKIKPVNVNYLMNEMYKKNQDSINLLCIRNHLRK